MRTFSKDARLAIAFFASLTVTIFLEGIALFGLALIYSKAFPSQNDTAAIREQKQTDTDYGK